jgi:hypothetical protein
MRDTVWEIIIGVVYVAIIFTLVRPGSKGPAVVNSVLDALTDLVKSTTGYGSISG